MTGKSSFKRHSKRASLECAVISGLVIKWTLSLLSRTHNFSRNACLNEEKRNRKVQTFIQGFQ